jgi:hypothetical protein
MTDPGPDDIDLDGTVRLRCSLSMVRMMHKHVGAALRRRIVGARENGRQVRWRILG